MRRTILIVLVYALVVFLGIFLGAVLGIKNAYPQQPVRRPPGEKPQQPGVVIDLPYAPPESEFFSGAVATYSGEGPKGERPDWSNFGRRPLIIGLRKGRDWQPREVIIEQELRRFALNFTRNVLTVHASPWEAKDKFKQIAADPRYCWLWVDAEVDSLSLAWYHCWDPICFSGSQAKLSVSVIEINPNSGEEFLILASTSHFTGHIHSWSRRLWIEAGSSENFYFFTARMLLRSQLVDANENFRKKLGR